MIVKMMNNFIQESILLSSTVYGPIYNCACVKVVHVEEFAPDDIIILIKYQGLAMNIYHYESTLTMIQL